MKMADSRDRRLETILRKAWAPPRPGWEAQVLEAMYRVRPRRHPNLVTVVVVILILLLLTAAAFAARRFFVKGTLRSFDLTWTPERGWGEDRHGGAQSFQGEGESRTAEKASQSDSAAVSPDGTEMVFGGDGNGDWPPVESGFVRADPDGSNRVNLTKAAGLGGVNCFCSWSPDGRMIAFIHSEPAPGELPCTAAFQVWVMKRDGTGAHRVVPPGFPRTMAMGWAPDGAHLLVSVEETCVSDPGELAVSQPQALLADIFGREAKPIPNIGSEATYSPDGSLVASVAGLPAVRDARPGYLKRLLLTKADGSNPRVLVEQFIADPDIAKHYPNPGQLAYNDQYDWKGDVSYYVGPKSL